MMAVGTLATVLLAQNFTQRGFVETRMLAYPQDAPNDSANFVGDALLRWEGQYRTTPWLSISGSFDARTDTHHQVARTWPVEWDGRTIQRPALSLRQLSATLHRGKWTAELGRQFIPVG